LKVVTEEALMGCSCFTVSMIQVN